MSLHAQEITPGHKDHHRSCIWGSRIPATANRQFCSTSRPRSLKHKTAELRNTEKLTRASWLVVSTPSWDYYSQYMEKMLQTTSQLLSLVLTQAPLGAGQKRSCCTMTSWLSPLKLWQLWMQLLSRTKTSTVELTLSAVRPFHHHVSLYSTSTISSPLKSAGETNTVWNIKAERLPLGISVRPSPRTTVLPRIRCNRVVPGNGADLLTLHGPKAFLTF